MPEWSTCPWLMSELFLPKQGTKCQYPNWMMTVWMAF